MKEENNNQIQNIVKEEIKIPVVENKPVVSVEKTEVVDIPTKEKKNKNGILSIVIIALIMVGFVIALPYITNLVNDDYHYNSGKTVEKDSENLVEGLIPLNKVAYMKVSKIRFYDFVNTTTNVISYKLMSEENIDSLKNLNIIIHLYNSNKELIYTYKLEEDISLKRSVLVNKEINLNEDVFKNVAYAKVTNNNSVSSIRTSISCTKETVINNTKINEENILYFVGSYLNSYDVIKDVYAVDRTNTDYINETNNLTTTYEELMKSNIDLSNIEKTDNKLSFTLDVNTYDKKESTYEVLYSSSYTDTLIKNIYKEKGYTCE